MAKKPMKLPTYKSMRLGKHHINDNPNFKVVKAKWHRWMTDEQMMEATRADTP